MDDQPIHILHALIIPSIITVSSIAFQINLHELNTLNFLHINLQLIRKINQVQTDYQIEDFKPYKNQLTVMRYSQQNQLDLWTCGLWACLQVAISSFTLFLTISTS
jgi:hypothetical protein